VPQIVYYVYAYTRLLGEEKIASGDKINVTVPTGNFGNILAAYYAKNMGLPIDRLLCASNENKVLYDFFTTGSYDKNREFVLTSSPSMDILISSNLERLIFHICGDDADKNRALMESLQEKGSYSIDDVMKAQLTSFYGNFATEQETSSQIKKVYEDTGYLIDPHTAVASSVYDKYVSATGDKTPTVIASTASPYKFTRTVMKAIGQDDESKSDLELTEDLGKAANVPEPSAISDIKKGEIFHKKVVEVSEMQQAVCDFLGV